MELVLSNQTNYADIFAIKENGKTIGTIEIKLAGREAGKKFFNAWAAPYTKRDIRRFYKELRK